MKAFMISIRPERCEKIANGQKIVEMRKSKPKLDPPFKCYIYCTKPKKILRAVYSKEDYRGYFSDKDYDQIPENYKAFVKVPDGRSAFCCPPYSGNIIGEFICIGYDEFTPTEQGIKFKGFSALHETGLLVSEINRYLKGKKGYGWRISDLVIYDEPKGLSLFQYYHPSAKWEAGYPMPTHEIKRPPQSWIYIRAL